MKPLAWFRLHTEFATDPVVQALSFDDQRHFVMLLCFKAAGLLDRQFADRQTRIDVIRKSLGLDGKAWDEMRVRLCSVGIIDDELQPVNWDKRQFRSDHEDPTKSERMKRWRDKKRNNNQDVESVDGSETDERRQGDGCKTAARVQRQSTHKSKAIMSGDAPDVAPFETQAREVLAFLNEKTGKRFQPVGTNLKMIVARLKEGYDVPTLRAIVAVKRREWWDDPKMRQYLRPATLFNATKAAQYRGELPS